MEVFLAACSLCRSFWLHTASQTLAKESQELYDECAGSLGSVTWAVLRGQCYVDGLEVVKRGFLQFFLLIIFLKTHMPSEA